MTEREELKPCPFCGGEGEVRDMRVKFGVRCKGCGITICGESHEWIDHVGDDADTDEEADALSESACVSIDWDAVRLSAISAWNNRKGATPQ